MTELQESVSGRRARSLWNRGASKRE